MKAVILAAGKCTDMFVLSDSRPKPMIPLAGKPMLEHLIVSAVEAGINEIFLVVGYREEMIRTYFLDGSKWGVKIHYQLRPEGEEYGSTLIGMSDMFTEGFLLLETNGLPTSDEIRRIISGHNLTCGIRIDGTRDFGRASILEGSRSDTESELRFTGLYYLSPEIFNAMRDTGLPDSEECDFTKPLTVLLTNNVIYYYCFNDSWQRLRYPWDLLEANEKLMNRIEPRIDGIIEPDVHMSGTVIVGQSSRIRSGTYIVGPVVIGDGCDIGPNAYLRAGTSIGDNCHIGAACEVKNSIVMRGSKIPHHNYVGDSIIGEGCNLGSGTKIANLRLDKRNVTVNDIDTGRRKFGAVLGDRVQTGINVSIDAGSIIGDDVFLWPGKIAHGFVTQEDKK